MGYKICSTCGNDIPEESVRCCYCNSPQLAGRKPPVRGKYVYTVNLKAGLPSVEEAWPGLKLNLCKPSEGARLVRVSTAGVPAASVVIKKAVAFFSEQSLCGQIRLFFPAMIIPVKTGSGRNLIKRVRIKKVNVQIETIRV